MDSCVQRSRINKLSLGHGQPTPERLSSLHGNSRLPLGRPHQLCVWSVQFRRMYQMASPADASGGRKNSAPEVATPQCRGVTGTAATRALAVAGFDALSCCLLAAKSKTNSGIQRSGASDSTIEHERLAWHAMSVMTASDCVQATSHCAASPTTGNQLRQHTTSSARAASPRLQGTIHTSHFYFPTHTTFPELRSCHRRSFDAAAELRNCT